jgi:hypothetical protein
MNAQHGGAKAISRGRQGGGGAEAAVMYTEVTDVEGATTVMYGADKMKASKNDIVILAPGVVHTNVNESGAPERHITLLLPQNESGPADVEFEMKAPAPARTGNAAAPTR